MLILEGLRVYHLHLEYVGTRFKRLEKQGDLWITDIIKLLIMSKMLIGLKSQKK